MAAPAPHFSHMLYTCSGYSSVKSNVMEAKTRCVEGTIDALLQHGAEYGLLSEMKNQAHF